ncbi:MAG: AbrB/MazE/SpoVT family DNA-binding domain-containing protein [Saccharolobus sp.]
MGIVEYILSLDERGRITIPKEIREKINFKKVRIVLENDKLILEPIKDDAVDKYYGIFKAQIKGDIDELIEQSLFEKFKEEIKDKK